MLEARTISSGATGRNGGHISTAALGDYNDLVDHIGTVATQKVVKFRLAHIDELFEVTRALGDKGVADSEIRRVESVSGILDEAALTRMKTQLKRFED